MCKYCNRKSLEMDDLIPIVVDDFLLFGETYMEICTALGTDEDGNIEEEIYLSGDCIARQKINFCPMCGQLLD